MLQTSLFGASAFGCAPSAVHWEPLGARSWVWFEPGWVQGSQALFDQLVADMPWRTMERPMYDRVVTVPRLICNLDVGSLEYDHPLAVITKALETSLTTESSKITFSSIGLNFYRDGNDSVAWHSDSVNRTRIPGTVALVSVGSPRTLAVRPKARKSPKTAETTRSTAATRRHWKLGHGDLLVMGGACQHDWEHGVPKERGVGPRISLAFRCKEAAEGPRIARAGVPPLLASHKLQ